MSLNIPQSLKREYSTGFTYVEILIAVVLISASLVPAMESLSITPRSLSIIEEQSSIHNALRNTMEEVLAESFILLENAATAAGGPTIPSSYSDSSGTTNRALVYLSLYDGDDADADDNGFTGTDANLLWIKVEIESTAYSLEMLTRN